MTKKKILIIEDDKEIAIIQKDYLENNGFKVIVENDGVNGQNHALSGGFALIILDLMLPGKDGIAICRDIREKVDIPIIMVTAKKEDNDKIRGLGFGADDFITKPFSLAELAARVKSHIARYERFVQYSSQARKQEDEIDFGWLRINKNTRRVFINELEIHLTRKEFDLLYFLAANPEILFSKEQIYNSAWGDDMYGDLKTVVIFLNRLREKIEKNPKKPKHIQTVWGTGYRFLPY